MAHDRSKSEMTDTATISRTELHGPHARSVKMIKAPYRLTRPISS
jgi:hypothetical protein